MLAGLAYLSQMIAIFTGGLLLGIFLTEPSNDETFPHEIDGDSD